MITKLGSQCRAPNEALFCIISIHYPWPLLLLLLLIVLIEGFVASLLPCHDGRVLETWDKVNDGSNYGLTGS